VRTTCFALGLAVHAVTASAQPVDAPSPQWQIEVTQPTREVIFTDLRTTHWATDSGARDQRAYGGLYTSMHESLDDYVLSLDGRSLEPARARRVIVTPWSMVREYDDGVRETVFLALGEAALFVRLQRGESRAARWSVSPRVDLRWIWKPEQGRYEVTSTETPAARNRTLRTVTAQRVGWTPGPGAPDRVVLAAFGREGAFVERQVPRPTTHPRDAARKAMERTTPVEIGTLEIAWAEGQRHVDLVFLPVRGERDDLHAHLEDLLVRRDLLLAERRAYFEAMAEGALRTGDARLDKTYLWARASMDQMIMHTRGAGIYAGFHWFTNFWGRDTFICLPGATLVTGRHDAAREILRSFLQFQLVDRDHPRQGRIPNIVQPDQLQYAGVDGTWWYARAAYQYIRARRAAGQADEVFEREFAAALALMIDGAERHAVDAYGLLRHGDGETWMDAGGETNPYSPRGDRAVEVQALYYNGLRIAEWLAREQGRTDRATVYAGLAERTARSFATMYWMDDLGRLADHLDVDGTQDRQLRPNTILALTGVEPEWPPLLTAEQMRAEIEIVYEKLVLPYGVTSLDPSDPDFHPKHLDLGNYYYDAAYHNGDVWYWLSGPMITALCRIGRVDEAVRMLDVLVRETLDHGAVGAIREIRDGADTGTTEEFGGATFQAWSMAELLRAMHEDLAPRLGWVR
jgi:hypothetical protein